MARVVRKFAGRSISEQQWLLENTWCDTCTMYDLGMIDPEEYEEDGRVFIEGVCQVCGNPIKSEIVDQRAESRQGEAGALG